MLNIGLIGTGKMGREISRLAIVKGHRVSSSFNQSQPLTRDALDKTIDVFIDFSHPEAVLSHVGMLANLRASLVLGTTGWNEQFEEVKNQALSSGMALVHAPNFSIGVSMFLRIVQAAGRLFDSLPNYDAFIHESHHRGKVDSPSGTALALAEGLMEQLRRKSEICTDVPSGPIAAHQLQVVSSRGGKVPGTHAIFFDSGPDTIELRHTARNRSGFALGALLAAEWVQGRKGFFTFNDVLEDLFE